MHGLAQVQVLSLLTVAKETYQQLPKSKRIMSDYLSVAREALLTSHFLS